MELELEKYSYERRKPTTINQCIHDLVNGYADAKVHMEVGKNLFEVIEDKWFHQFPLVRYKYASMLKHGYFCGRWEDDYIDGDNDLAEKILLPMAEAGLATAQYDMGWGFHSGDPGSAYEENVKWMLKASKQDYYAAHIYLAFIFEKVRFEDFSIELQMEFLSEIARVFSNEWKGEYAKEKLNELQKKEGEDHGSVSQS